MAKYYEAESLLEFVKQNTPTIDGQTTMGCVERAIKEAPTADVVEVKHGEWATDEEDIYWGNSLKRKHCSVCKSRPYFDKEEREFVVSDYCPNCGAKMDGGNANGR